MKILREDEMRKRISEMGADVVGNTPEEFGAAMRAESAQWAEIIKVGEHQGRMKIYILDAFHPAGPEYAARHFDVVRWDDPRVKNWAEEADGVMVRMTPIRAADLARAKKVKVICKQGVGFDSIDIAAAAKHGIPVLRTPGVNSEAVAEMAMALALSATRRVTECDTMLRAGAKIERPKILGVEMWQKTVGVIGMGNIGSRVARKWQGAFEAKVIYLRSLRRRVSLGTKSAAWRICCAGATW